MTELTDDWRDNFAYPPSMDKWMGRHSGQFDPIHSHNRTTLPKLDNLDVFQSIRILCFLSTGRGVGQGHAGHAMACPDVGTLKWNVGM